MLQYLVTFKGFFQHDERILQMALDAVWFLKTHPKYLVNQNMELGGITESFNMETISLWSLQDVSPAINLQLKQNIQKQLHNLFIQSKKARAADYFKEFSGYVL